jgi:hypothetical protein
VASFQFKSTKKSYEIKDENGNLLKTYIVDVGNADTLKAIIAKYNALLTKEKQIRESETSSDSVDALIEMQKEIVNSLLDNDFEYLWEECGHNVFSMLALLNDLIGLINEAMRAGQ